jgi:hypothetical protein
MSEIQVLVTKNKGKSGWTATVTLESSTIVVSEGETASMAIESMSLYLRGMGF